MKTLYKTLLEKLTADTTNQLLSAAGLPPVKYVDIYEGQYYNPEKFEGLVLPAVLVEFSIDKPQLTEPGQLSLTLHILYEQPEHGDNHAPHIDRALKYLDFAEKIYELVKDTESEHTGKLVWNGESSIGEPGIVKVLLQTYSASYTGRSNMKEYDETELQELSITGNLKTFDKALNGL